MNSYYAKPITIIALIQLAIILLGMGAASVVARGYKDYYEFMPASTWFIFQYGFILTIIPITWTSITAYINSNDKYTEKKKVMFIISGIVIAVILAISLVAAILGPISQLDSGIK
ncbi:MAG: hypothetical protein PF692_00755 [Kiritimatiellae bacterium]|jgi:uncharacterized membrane protein|nr:hypothetical protein [Kiritimatiellia bacterium]